MTQTDQWMFCLALVYAVPSFVAGLGITLFVIRRQDLRHATAKLSGFLAPNLTLEHSDFRPLTPTQTDDSHELLV